ncbi:MAG TPA: hypothetical protein VGG61_14020 [Gemmataceae bacterium]
MPMILAEFDGRVFVPSQPVQLPPGTRVEVVVPTNKDLTDEDKRQWQAILQELNASVAAFPTVEEALRYTRKRP